ncbi:MAG: PhzF family phenazine biosynthesis protein [Chloroflexota bacterium]
MPTPIYQVDAFTATPFAGNPAAVCLLSEPKTDDWLQNVACEMNLAETAFLWRRADGFDLRWFTPVLEVDLCGHATLASAHTLWEQGALPSDEAARFRTRSGLLTCLRVGEWIEMDFPVKPAAPTAAPAGLLEGLGVAARWVGRSQFDYLVEVDSAAIVRACAPDFALLKTVPARGVIVTSAEGAGEFDFVSRFFDPLTGLNEDPVTGSAHCTLAPYWAERLGKSEMRAYQASARGGVVRVRNAGERVFVAGQAVTVLRGELVW